MFVEVLGLCYRWGSCVFRGVGAVSKGGAAVYSGVGGYSWVPVLRHVMGLREDRCPSGEMMGRVLTSAQNCLREPLFWGRGCLPTPRPCAGVWRTESGYGAGGLSICLSLCPGQRSRAASSLPGGQQRISTHPSAFRWLRQEPPQSCLEGITVFEEAQAGGWGELHSKQSSWRLL